MGVNDMKQFLDEDLPFTVAVWTENGGMVAEWQGKYRVVNTLPCMLPWGEQ